VAAAFGLALVCLLLSSPVARAAIIETLQKVGRLNFQVSDQYPRATTTRVLTPYPYPLEEALDRFPVVVRLPGWMPEGFLLNEPAEVILSEDPPLHAIHLRWTHAVRASQIGLKIEYAPGSEDWLTAIGQDSLEPVQVLGEPAALVRGIWNPETHTWELPGFVTLYWRRGGLSYQIQTLDPDLSVEDLVRIAESIPD
jgi:hypothetical protein